MTVETKALHPQKNPEKLQQSNLHCFVSFSPKEKLFLFLPSYFIIFLWSNFCISKQYWLHTQLFRERWLTVNTRSECYLHNKYFVIFWERQKMQINRNIFGTLMNDDT